MGFAEAWDYGFIMGLGDGPFSESMYDNRDLQRCYRQGYEFGQSNRADRQAREANRYNLRDYGYPLSEHDLEVIDAALVELIRRDEYHDTDHARDLHRYLFGEES